MIEKNENEIKLRPMSKSEFLSWLPQQIEHYAASKVKSGNWVAEEALSLAARQMAELLPDGPDTKDHLIFSVEVDDRGDAVKVIGRIWVNIKRSALGTSAFLYDIEIDEKHRSRGYGSKAIMLLEDRLRNDGVTSLALHVFGYNVKAQALYTRLGFEVTNINMAKKI